MEYHVKKMAALHLLSTTTMRTDGTMGLDSKRLIELRKKRGWKESDLAKAIGSTQGAISRYETGTRQPPAEVAARLATALDTSIDYLCGRTDNPDSLEISQMKTPAQYYVIELFQSGALDLEKLTALNKFRDLPKSRQELLIAQLKGKGRVLNKRNR